MYLAGKRESCPNVVLWGKDVAVPSCGRCWDLRRFGSLLCLMGDPWVVRRKVAVAVALTRQIKF